MADLAALQRAFFDRVTASPPDAPDAHDAHDAPDAPQAPPGAPGDAASSAPLIASGELEIYARMYAIRLHDALAEDYPKLRAALGDERFAAIAAAYLRAHPPRSFTLRAYGDQLAHHLRASPLAPPWAADLAALERARVEVFDGPDARPLAHAEVVAVGDGLPDLVLAWVPSSAVVALGWAVDDLWSAIEDDQPTAPPVEEPRVVLVWRRDIAVLHRTLDRDEAELAPRIAGGARFAELCELLGAAHGEDAGPRAAELLLRWLGAEAIAALPTR